MAESTLSPVEDTRISLELVNVFLSVGLITLLIKRPSLLYDVGGIDGYLEEILKNKEIFGYPSNENSTEWMKRSVLQGRVFGILQDAQKKAACIRSTPGGTFFYCVL